MNANPRAWLASALLALSAAVLLRVETFSEEPAGEKAAVAKSEEYDWKPFLPGDNLQLPREPGQRQRFVGLDQRKADFSGKNLMGHTFCDVDARGAKFDGANLRHAIFIYNTKLDGASFRGADLRRVRFIDCEGLKADNDLTDALINDTFRNPGDLVLTEKQLRSTKSFKEQNLSDCSLVIEGAPALDLRHFDLRNMRIQMDFSNCRMEGADLSGSTILRGSKISQEQIDSTSQWAGADFRWAGSELTIYCPVEGIKFGRYKRIDSLAFNPEEADLTDISWNTRDPGLPDYFRRPGNVTFLEGTLTKEQLYSTANYKHKNLRFVNFRGLKDDNWDFSGQDLTDATFRGVGLMTSPLRLPRANFTDAIITHTVVELTPEQFKSTWNYKKGVFRDVILMGKNRDELQKLRDERIASEQAENAARN